MTLKIPFLFFFIYPIISSAGLVVSTNQINCVYEDSALSERARRLIREDLSRAMARDLEKGNWYESCLTVQTNETSKAWELTRNYSCNWPDEIRDELDKVILGTNGVASVFISQKCSDAYKQKIALIDQYPTLYPSLCAFVSFLADKNNLHNLTDTEELNYVLPMISSDGSLEKAHLKYSFDKDLFFYPPSFGSIMLMPPPTHEETEIDFLGYHFSRIPNPETHMPNFIARFYYKEPNSNYSAPTVPVIFITNCWKILNY